MSYYRSQSFRHGPFGGLLAGLPPGVRWILIVTSAVGLLQFFYYLFFPDHFSYQIWFGVTPALFIRGALWQPLTYQFLHAGLLHFAMNMFMLWMFGTHLERLWGWRRFVRYYLVCGYGGGVAYALSGFLPAQNMAIPVVGASGSLFGVLLAYALLFPNRTIYVLPLPVPIRARTLVIALAVLSLVWAVGGGGGNIAHFAHLGGLATGYLLLRGVGGIRSLLGGGSADRSRRRRFRVVRGEGGNGESHRPARGPWDVH